MAQARRYRTPIDLGGPHYVIVRSGGSWCVVVHRNGAAPQTIEAASLAAATRLARPYSDDGLIGIVEGAP